MMSTTFHQTKMPLPDRCIYNHFLGSSHCQETSEDGQAVISVRGKGTLLNTFFKAPPTSLQPSGDRGVFTTNNLTVRVGCDDASGDAASSDLLAPHHRHYHGVGRAGSDVSGLQSWLEISTQPNDLATFSLVLKPRADVGLVLLSVCFHPPPGGDLMEIVKKRVATPSELYLPTNGPIKVGISMPRAALLRHFHSKQTPSARRRRGKSTRTYSRSGLASSASGRLSVVDEGDERAAPSTSTAYSSTSLHFSFHIKVYMLAEYGKPLEISPEHSFKLISCVGSEHVVLASLLASRSPVFNAMLAADMREAQTGQVVLDDLDAPVLDLLSQHVTPCAPSVQHVATNPHFPASALALLLLADRYGMPGLRELCCMELCGHITGDNVCEILVTAGRLQLPLLQKRGYDYLRENVTPDTLKKLPNYSSVEAQYELKTACDFIVSNDI